MNTTTPLSRTRKTLVLFGILLLVGGLNVAQPSAAEMSNHELRQKLEEAQKRLDKLEQQLGSPTSDAASTTPTEGSQQGLPQRVRKLEEQAEKGAGLGALDKKVDISGVVEVEGTYTDTDYDETDKDDKTTSDLTLATVELGVEADVAKHVSAQVLFKKEDDDSVMVDEGFITLDGADVLPMYLDIGKLYVPFGNYASHFISDPLTLEIGETLDTAAKIGFAHDMIDLSVAAYNGDGDTHESEERIKSFVGSAAWTLPQGVIPDLGLSLGASYISNIADSDGLSGELSHKAYETTVGGIGSFLILSYLEQFFFEAEYVGATDDFEDGALGFGNDEKVRPTAWNFELAYAPIEKLELAARYEGADDVGNWQPERRYGAAATYSLFANTSLALEYLHATYDNDNEENTLTSQLAVAF